MVLITGPCLLFLLVAKAGMGIDKENNEETCSLMVNILIRKFIVLKEDLDFIVHLSHRLVLQVCSYDRTKGQSDLPCHQYRCSIYKQ